MYITSGRGRKSGVARATGATASLAPLNMMLEDDIKEYWGFYLLRGSIVRLSVCSRHEGASFIMVKDLKNAKRCAWLGELDSEEESDEEEDSDSDYEASPKKKSASAKKKPAPKKATPARSARKPARKAANKSESEDEESEEVLYVASTKTK